MYVIIINLRKAFRSNRLLKTRFTFINLVKLSYLFPYTDREVTLEAEIEKQLKTMLFWHRYEMYDEEYLLYNKPIILQLPAKTSAKFQGLKKNLMLYVPSK
nr:hypothetical protein [Maribacter hydrothermalis]